jgi:cell division inhibitor SepF
MTSMWRRAMLYLGLGPDEEFDDYDDDAALSRSPAIARYPVSVPVEHEPAAIGALRPVGQPERPSSPASRPSVVRPIHTATAKPHVVMITSFNDAQEVGDRFKGNQPVIVNLQSVDKDLSRRMVDFASGLCYGRDGHMERIASQVYLLVPTNVEVSAEDKRRLQERGYAEQQ